MRDGEKSETDTQQTLEAERRNGVYLLEVSAIRDGYLVESVHEPVIVSDVSINGNYVGTSEQFETECDDYTVSDGELTLWYSEGDT